MRLISKYASTACLLLGLFLIGGAGCLKDLTPAGSPCRNTADCWSLQYECVNKVCQRFGTKSEPTTEPTPDASQSTEENNPIEKPTSPEPSKPDGPPQPICPTPEPNGRSIYEACYVSNWTNPPTKCKCGLTCHRLSPLDAVCLPDCAKNDGYCKQYPGTICRTVEWRNDSTPIRVCVKEVASGERCDPSQGIFCKSENGAGNTCTNGKCTEVKMAKLGQACNTLSNPPILCDAKDGLFCHSNGLCTKGDTPFEWDICPKKLCPYGTSCKNIGAESEICLRSCKQDTDCKQYSGLPMKCIGGTCAQAGCVADSQCTGWVYGMICGTSPNATVTFCGPKATLGTQRYMEICTRNSQVRTKRCDGMFQCVQFGPNPTESLCVLSCQTDQDCQLFHPKDRCMVPAGNQRTFCGRPCKTANECPQGYKCDGPTNRTVCMPSGITP